jgi:mxaJ protein
MGVPAAFDLMMPSQPYYSSRYVFVVHRGRRFHSISLRDTSLRQMRIGVHLIEDDEYVPPARELLLNGMRTNLVGFPIRGNPLSQNPSGKIVKAVAEGQVDVALVWGPTAGYFAAKSAVPLAIYPICDSGDRRAFPLQFAMSIGVRRGDARLLRDVNRSLTKHRPQIARLLREYHVPSAEALASSGCR